MKKLLRAATWGFAFLLAAAIMPLSAQVAPELQEQGVLYLDGNLPGKVYATIHTVTTVYTHRDFQTAVAALYGGQKIEFVGVAKDGYIIKASVRNNTVTGWIQSNDLPTGVDTSVFALAQKNQTRRDAVAAAIQNKTVIQGMTSDEVRQALGKPEQVNSSVGPNGSTLTWIYTTYREDPQYQYTLDVYGRPVLTTYYVKVPIGQMIIAFANDAVVSIVQHKTDPSSPGVVTG